MGSRFSSEWRSEADGGRDDPVQGIDHRAEDGERSDNLKHVGLPLLGTDRADDCSDLFQSSLVPRPLFLQAM